MTQQLKHIRKALQMELIKSQIQVSLTKGELNTLIAEALADPESSAAIKKVLNPLLAGQFAQFTEFTNIMIGDTDEATGATLVTLKQPAAKPAKSNTAKAIEPEPEEEPEEAPIFDDEPVPSPEDSMTGGAPEYIDPIS